MCSLRLVTAAVAIDTPDETGQVPGGRMGFLDALRGVAVSCVVLQHVGMLTSSTLREFCSEWVQVGQLGVMVFFLCSGFIIPATLERNGSLKTFWLSRFFRLYPLYWMSLLFAGLLAALGHAVRQGLAGPDWVVNATMVQDFLGAEQAVGVYWSLAYEMVFYVAISFCFLLGVHRRSVELSLLVACAAIAVSVLCLIVNRPAPLASFLMVTMFTGTVVYRLYVGTISRWTALLTVAVSALAGAVVLWAALHGYEQVEFLGTRTLRPMAFAWLGAYVLFGAGVVLWRRSGAPRLLRRLGLISYSVYLMQELVLAAVPRVGNGLVSALVWCAVIVAVSATTYALVERPAIALGRGLIARSLAGREGTTAGAVDVAPPRASPGPS